ncbi:MAG TPA: hypothetical protein DCK98_01160 [Chloroflexi bacterium]|nr:hypothetical protein [Chloroflexota bacterium]HAL27661.1 hypothetical protein [Chloroflexota bacterium]
MRTMQPVSDAPDWSAGPILSLTRIRFKHWWLMLFAWLRFRRLYRSRLAGSSGPLRGAVMIEDTSTLVNITLWRDKRSLLLWSGNDRHVDEVRWTYSRSVETWSALSLLKEISPSARSWAGYFVPEPLSG